MQFHDSIGRSNFSLYLLSTWKSWFVPWSITEKSEVDQARASFL
jgi:hypothetical protein